MWALTYQSTIERYTLPQGFTILDYTIREICNMVHGHIVADFRPPEDEDGDSIPDQIAQFEEKIGLRVSAETKAMELARASMIARGIDPDAVPELSPELKAKMEEDAMKDMSDKELFFSGRAHSGKEFMGQRIKGD